MKLLDDVHSQQGPDFLLHDLIYKERHTDQTYTVKTCMTNIGAVKANTDLHSEHELSSHCELEKTQYGTILSQTHRGEQGLRKV